jgi:hypothetical protein
MTTVLHDEDRLARNTERVQRLNSASLKRIIEPDTDIPGSVAPGQILGDELLSVHGLPGIELTPAQKATLSREETASMYELGLRIEAVLMAGFAMAVVSSDVTDPRVAYRLHEVGEETRHSRAFARVITSIEPTVHHPVNSKLMQPIMGVAALIGLQLPAMFNLMVLSGEEIPDLLQRKAIEHPETDPFVKAVAKYHRQEEARHISFARLLIPELWQSTHAVDRFLTKHYAPIAIGRLFDFFVHPLVYRAVGLPAIKTWLAVRKNPARVAIRHDATRPILEQMIDAGCIKRGRVPRGWRRLCGVDRHAVAVG